MLCPDPYYKGERFARSLLVFLTLLFCLTLPAKTKANDPPRHESSRFEELTAPDYPMTQSLEKAFAFLQTDRYAQAIPLLQSLLDSDFDYFLLPVRYEFAKSVKWRSENNDTHSDTLVRTIRDTLARLPDKGKEIYSILHEKPVRIQLDEAVSHHDLSTLQRIGTRYFSTLAGREAAWLAASQLYAQGNTLTALQLIEPFDSLPFEASSSFEPELSVMMVDLFVKYGQTDRAKKRLADLSQALPDIFSNDGKLLSTETVFANYVKYHSGSDRNNDVNACSSLLPWGNGKVNPIPNDFRTILLSGKKQSGMTFDSDFIPLLMKGIAVPTQTPTVDGNTVIFPDRFDLVALDSTTGKQRWRCSPTEIALNGSAENSDSSFNHEIWNRIGNAWSCFNAVSNRPVADHGTVYSVEFSFQSEQFEKALFQSAEQAQTTIVLPEMGNTLVARSVTDGSVLWQVGHVPYCEKMMNEVNKLKDAKMMSADDWASRLNILRSQYTGETVFCTVPLVLDGRVHLCGYSRGEIAWYVFDAKSGKALRRIPLVQNAFSPLELQSNGLCHEMPVARDGVAVCVAGNMLIALDYEFGRLLWAYRWNSPEENLRRGTILNIDNRLTNALYDHKPLTKHRLVFFKQFVLFFDSTHSTLHCIDPFHGHLLWKRSIPDTLDIFNMFDGNLLVTAVDGVFQAVVSRDKCGEYANIVKYDDDQVPLGHGCLAGNVFWQPMQNGQLARIDLEKHTIQYLNVFSKTKEPQYGGNIFVVNNQIFYQSWSCLYLLNMENNVPEQTISDEWKQPLALDETESKDNPCPLIHESILWKEGKISGHKRENDIPDTVIHGTEMFVYDRAHVCSCLGSCRFFWNESNQTINIYDGYGKCTDSIPVVFNKQITEQSKNDLHQFAICDGYRLVFLARNKTGKFTLTGSLRRNDAQMDISRPAELHNIIPQYLKEIQKRTIQRPLSVTQSDGISAWIDNTGMIQIVGTNGKYESICPGKNEAFLHVCLMNDKIGVIANRYSYGKRKEKQPNVQHEYHLLEISLTTGNVVSDKPWKNPVFAMDRIICDSKPESNLLQVANIDTPDKPILSEATNTQRCQIRSYPMENMLAFVLGETLHLFDTIKGTKLFEAKIPSDSIKATMDDIVIQREGDSFLVMYCFPADQKVSYDSFVPIANMTEKPVPRALIMRFDSTGKPLWPNHVFIEQTCPFKMNGTASPVYLFGKEVMATKDSSAYRVITALDRMTGKRRFQAKIPIDTQKNNAKSENGVWIDDKSRSVYIRFGREIYQFKEGES